MNSPSGTPPASGHSSPPGSGSARSEQLAAYCPELGSQVLVGDEVWHDANRVRVLKDVDTGRSFKVGTKEHFLIARMDGTRTIAQLGGDYAEKYGRRLGDANWQQLLGMLGSRGLLADTPAAQREDTAEEDPERPNSLLRGSIRLFADADATADRLHRVVGGVLARRWMVPLFLLVLAMEALAVVRLDELLEGTWALLRNPVLLTGVAALLWLSTALHELAHGVVARHYGGQVSEIGLRWRLPAVIMYCRVDNYLYLPTRGQRIATAVAGAVMNLLFLLPFCAVWLLVPVDEGTGQALAALLFLGSVQAFAMLVPLPPLDGYKIVSQLAGATDLAGSSRRYLSRRSRRQQGATPYPRRARLLYTGYAFGSALLLCGLAVAVVALIYSAITSSG